MQIRYGLRIIPGHWTLRGIADEASTGVSGAHRHPRAARSLPSCAAAHSSASDEVRLPANGSTCGSRGAL